MSTQFRLPVLILSFALAITACTYRAPQVDTSATTPTEVAPAAEAVALTCSPPTRVCVGCSGTLFCGVRCPECAPPVVPNDNDAPAATVANLTPVAERCGAASDRPGLL